MADVGGLAGGGAGADTGRGAESGERSPLIAVEPVGDHILLVRMQSPPVNAWTDDFTVALEEVADSLADTRARAVVITGSGRHFSAGGDFHLFQTIIGEEAARAFVTRAQRVMDKIAAIPAPVIAAVNGTALGGGLELALACDIRIAAPAARLGLPEVQWGILAGAGGTQRLARLVGPGAAKLMMFTAQPVDADEALRIGLVDRIDPDAVSAALEVAEQIAANSPRAIRSVKESVDLGLPRHLDEGLRLERELWIDLIPDGDLQEGARAFFERRTPDYPDWPRG